MMNEKSGRVTVISGGSSGIGAALAVRLARRPGAVIGLVGRNPDRLAAVAEACSRSGARTVTAAIDVRDRATLADWLVAFDRDQPIDCVIANAGVAAGSLPGGPPERGAQAHDVMDINLGGVMNLVVPIVPLMQARRAGQIGLVSSLSAFAPLPEAAAYSASKAAVLAYGLALRQSLRHDGVGVTTLCPGFVTTPMSQTFRGWRPLEMSAEAAARRIEAAIDGNRRLVAFPWALATVSRLTPLLPEAVLNKAMTLFRI